MIVDQHRAYAGIISGVRCFGSAWTITWFQDARRCRSNVSRRRVPWVPQEGALGGHGTLRVYGSDVVCVDRDHNPPWNVAKYTRSD